MSNPIRPNSFANALLLMLLTTCMGSAATITTTFTSNNEGDGNMFDVHVFGVGVVVERFWVNTHPDSGTQPLYLYTRVGSYAGHTNSAAGWTLQDVVTITNAPGDTPVEFDITDLALAANTTYGFYIVGDISNGSVKYTDGTFDVSNSHLQLAGGVGISFRGGTHFTNSGVYTPRTWNGSIEYTANPEPSTYILMMGALVGLGVLRRRRR